MPAQASAHLQTPKDALHPLELAQPCAHLQTLGQAVLPSLIILCGKPNLHSTCLNLPCCCRAIKHVRNEMVRLQKEHSGVHLGYYATGGDGCMWLKLLPQTPCTAGLMASTLSMLDCAMS